MLTESVPDPSAPGAEGDLARVLERAGTLADLDGQAVVREYFETLSDDDARLLALLFPAAIGNLAGAPFKARADANAVRIAVNLQEWEEAMGDPVRELYEDILANDRQIVLFDPEGDGAMVEMFGSPGPETQNAGIYVPGTGSNLENFVNVAEKAKRLRGDNSVTFAWLGGDFPDGAEAGSAAHAMALAPGLASFTHQVRQELIHAGSPSTAEISLEGHSYGGAVVGYTENFSPDAQTVLHIESAGMGHDIFTPDDLPASQEDVVRYSMTAPDDWIAPIQGAQEHSSAIEAGGAAVAASNPATIGLVFPWNDVASTLGHGADPDEFEGMTRLHTGNFSDNQPPVPGRPEIQPGAPIIGTPAHSNVFQVGSDAENNMAAIVNGQKDALEYYREPIWGSDGGRLVLRGYDPTETVVGWGPEQEPE